ncbi:MAG: PAS domain S-box protein [Flavobacterium sp.]|nr:PAS domain S-box protein [Flavobacterium sp.]
MNQKLLTELFNTSPAPSLVLLNDAPKFTIIDVNEIYLKISQTKKGDLIGNGIFEAFPENENNVKSQGFKHLTKSLHKVAESKKSHQMAILKHDIPIRGTSKFEVKYWKIKNIPLIGDGGAVQMIVHTVVDITEKILSNIKAAEAKLNIDKGIELLKQTENILKLGRWEIDMITKKVYWSDNHYTMLGYEPQEFEITLDKFFELIFPEDRERVKAQFDDAFSEVKDYNLEFRFITKNNSVINVLTKNTFVYDDEGNLQNQVGVVQNVTDIIEAGLVAKKAIDESNERFEYVNKATSDAIWDWDVASDVIYWGEGFEKIFNHRISNLETNSSGWLKNIHAEDLETTTNNFYHILKSTETNWKEEYRYKNGNGEYCYVINKGIVIRDDNNRVKRIIGAMQDVSKQKQEEQRLKLLESVITNAIDSVLITDIESFDYPGPKILYVNEAFTKMTGYTAEEVIGKTPRILQGPKSDKEKLKELSLAIRRFQPFETTLLNYKKNGEEFWVNLIINPVANERGFFTHWIAIQRDVTERIDQETKLAETNQKLSETLESIQDGFYTLDSNWNISYFNKEAERLSGKCHKELLGKNILEVYTGQVSEGIFAQFQEAKKQNKRIRLESYSKRLDKWFEINAFPSSSGLTVYFKDISERKETESKILQMNLELEANIKRLAISNEELEQFAYVASHDLQEPLRMVTGFLTQIEKKYENLLDEKGKKYIYFAVDGAKRMRQIILDILEFSRIGKNENKLEEINLNDIIKETKLLFIKQIEEKNAVICCNELPLIKSYLPPVRQIFQNLISNSLKYSQSELSPNITISSKEDDYEWKFEITDNGIGIDSAYFDKIFIIFQRLHNKDEYSGTGIGLAITKKIIENLGGQIWVTSIEGEGSSFYFTIPKNKI